MNKSALAAVRATEELGKSAEAYLDRALKKSEAQTCDGCQIERATTEKGLTITRAAGALTVQAYRTPVEGFESPDISLEVSWRNGVNGLPDVSMNFITDGEILPRDLTLSDYPWIATTLGYLIEIPHLRVVR